MLETSDCHFAFVTTPGAESATGPVIGPSRRVHVTVGPLPGVRGKPVEVVNVISDEVPLTDEERVAVAENVHILMMFGCYTPKMIESVGWDFQVRQPEPAPPPPSLDDEMFDCFEDYTEGWKHVE